MTQGIRDMLNLPNLSELVSEDEAPPTEEEADDSIREAIALMERAEKQIALTDGTDHAKAMDELYKEILQKARDLTDLGYNIDPARSRGIFEVSATMYKHAMDAKNSKRDAELKMLKLMLDQRKLDLEERRVNSETGEAGTMAKTESTVIDDRNALIEQMRQKMQKG